jgi:hypothetical protein
MATTNRPQYSLDQIPRRTTRKSERQTPGKPIGMYNRQEFKREMLQLRKARILGKGVPTIQERIERAGPGQYARGQRKKATPCP